jgi:phosphoribosyl 1,2-cyclic phosphodiesterase
MKLTLWGTRGSLASPGPDTVRYGGNTCCAEVRNDAGSLLVIDAGTGIRRLQTTLPDGVKRVDVLLTHLHMDHIQGLGFFDALYNPDLEVHMWGPASARRDLSKRLTRYLSPPLFPVRLRDLDCELVMHDVRKDNIEIPGFTVSAARVNHPGLTIGYRIEADGRKLAHLSDHEPMLTPTAFEQGPDWISGYSLAEGVDVLVHDSQYTAAEYETRVGWGHSTIEHAARFAAKVGAKKWVPFHHDPSHDDAMLDKLYAQIPPDMLNGCEVVPLEEGHTLVV